MVIIMRYKVKQIEYSEFVIEGKDEEEIREWLRSNTIKEIQTINKNIVKHYSTEVIGKTVFPADITIDDFCEDIVDEMEWENRNINDIEESGN